MILLDTNVISELMKDQVNVSVLDWVDGQLETDLYLCAISKAEIQWGVGLLDDGKRKKLLQESAEAVFELFSARCLDYRCDAASHYADIAILSRRLGRPMSTEDMMIVAVAKSHEALLVTRNIKDFDFLPDLKLFNPWESRN